LECVMAVYFPVASQSPSMDSMGWLGRQNYYSTFPLAPQLGKMYNLTHSEGVSAWRPDREGGIRWKSPQGSSAEVVWIIAEEIQESVESRPARGCPLQHRLVIASHREHFLTLGVPSCPLWLKNEMRWYRDTPVVLI
jgi:hypothetical protein